MDFEYSDKTEELALRVTQFMRDYIYPNEPVFDEQVADGDRWSPVPVLQDLKDTWFIMVRVKSPRIAGDSRDPGT